MLQTENDDIMRESVVSVGVIFNMYFVADAVLVWWKVSAAGGKCRDANSENSYTTLFCKLCLSV